MKCKECGNEIPDGDNYCPNCGTNSKNNSQNYVPMNYSEKARRQSTNVISIIYLVAAGLILVLSLLATYKIMDGAGELSSLTSLAGNTIAEAYYNECGIVYGGFALFVLAFGLFSSGLIAYLGYKNFKK